MADDYFDIQESVADARATLTLVKTDRDIDDVINLCEQMLNLIDTLNERDAPQ